MNRRVSQLLACVVLYITDRMVFREPSLARWILMAFFIVAVSLAADAWRRRHKRATASRDG